MTPMMIAGIFVNFLIPEIIIITTCPHRTHTHTPLLPWAIITNFFFGFLIKINQTKQTNKRILIFINSSSSFFVYNFIFACVFLSLFVCFCFSIMDKEEPPVWSLTLKYYCYGHFNMFIVIVGFIFNMITLYILIFYKGSLLI